jgi:Ca2+-dependent lipid-binding protein
MTTLPDDVNIEDVSSITIELKIIQGEDLIAKDRSMTGRRTTSDPYVKVYLGGKCYGHNTKVVLKDLNPVWNDSFKILVAGKQLQEMLRHPYPLRLVIFDEDKTFTEDDLMGVVDVPLKVESNANPKWKRVRPGEEEKPEDETVPHFWCHNAQGKLKIQMNLSMKTKQDIYG